MSEKIHKRGRHSKAEQLEIKSELEECFQKSVSVATAKLETWYEIKTIRKYYRIFYDENKKTKEDFIEQSKIEAEQSALAIEHQILKLYDLDNLKKQIQNSFLKDKTI